MTNNENGAIAATDFELLVKISMDMSVFSSNWAYCDRLSSYVAKMVSHNRTDSLLYSNLFSSAFNELLETAHRLHDNAGEFVCSVSRRSDRDRIELNIPCGPAEATFYRQAVSRMSRQDLSDQYHAALFSEGPLDPAIGLLELAVDYDARLVVEEADGGWIRLLVELCLEEDED